MRAAPDIQERGIDMSPVSKAQQKATAKYIKNNYDRIEVKVPKGRKEELMEHAQQRGESLNAFMSRAIDTQLEQDNGSAQPGGEDTQQA